MIPIDPEKLVMTKEEVNKVLALHGSSIPSWAEFDEHHPSKQLCKAQVQAVLSSPILSAYIDKQVKEAAKEIEEEYRAYAKEWAILGSLEIIDQKVKEAREQELKEVEQLLDISDSELGFVEISNHIPFSQWQALKGKE